MWQSSLPAPMSDSAMSAGHWHHERHTSMPGWSVRCLRRWRADTKSQRLQFMKMPSPLRNGLLAVVIVAVLVPTVVKIATARRGSQVANDLCSWLNTKTSEPAPLKVGPEAQAILDAQRATGAPVACTTGSSPHAESFLTETAILLHPSRGAVVGLRVAPLGDAPHVLGYWTPEPSEGAGTAH